MTLQRHKRLLSHPVSMRQQGVTLCQHPNFTSQSAKQQMQAVRVTHLHSIPQCDPLTQHSQCWLCVGCVTPLCHCAAVTHKVGILYIMVEGCGTPCKPMPPPSPCSTRPDAPQRAANNTSGCPEQQAACRPDAQCHIIHEGGYCVHLCIQPQQNTHIGASVLSARHARCVMCAPNTQIAKAKSHAGGSGVGLGFPFQTRRNSLQNAPCLLDCT